MKRSPAFTLVELLVALAITVVLVLLLTSIVAATLGAWTQGRNRLDTFSSARQVLGRIGDELKGAIASPAVSGGQIQFVENASLGEAPSPIPSKAENVFFLAPQPNLGAGDLCVIAYSLDYNTHELKRAFLSSDAAFNTGPSPTPPRYQASAYAFQASDWHVVATGVLEFELQCYSQNDLDTNQAPAVTWDSESTNTYMAGTAPRRIVIRLEVVDDRAAAQLAGLTEGSTAYTQIVQRAARQFVSEISLPPP